LLKPVGEALATTFPGDPPSRPWEDLAGLSQPVETERFQFGTYFICSTVKPQHRDLLAALSSPLIFLTGSVLRQPQAMRTGDLLGHLLAVAVPQPPAKLCRPRGGRSRPDENMQFAGI
jgi:hypothetical protein